VVILGDEDVAKGQAVLRYMISKQQQEIPFDKLEAALTARKAN
jgi:histidyl-tRNA synthetase